MKRGTRAATESLGFLVIIGGILIVLNVLGAFVWGRLDCTEKKLFSLSDGSERLASSLTDTLKVTAYFTEDLPPPFNATERYVSDILTEYEAASGGNIEVEFVHVDTDEEKEAAEEAGIRRVSHRAIENDSLQVREGYRGLVMQYLDKTEVMPVIEDTGGLEYQLTMKLKKMLGEQRPIGILTGHEGPTRSEGLSKLAGCLPTYEIREVGATSPIDEELAALLVVAPKTELTQTELRHINQYVMKGGSLGIFGGGMKISTEEGLTASAADTGLNELLRPWGVVLGDGIVADARSAQAPLRTQLGMIPVPHPPVPTLSFDEAQSEHPVLFRLDTAHMPFVSPVEMVSGGAPEGVNAEVLARSSEVSWLLSGDSIELQPRAPREWQQTGDAGPFPLMVALEGKLPSAFGGEGEMSGEEAAVPAPAEAEADVRVLVVGSGFVLRDEIMPQTQTGQECPMTGTLAFALNSIDWLAQDSDLIAIRAKNVEDPQIDVPQDVTEAEEEARAAAETAAVAQQTGDEETFRDAEQEVDEALERRKEALASWDVKKAVYRWGNMIGIPLLFGLFGLIRWQIRKNKRKNIKL